MTETKAQKWKYMKNRKAQTFSRIGPDVDSNFHRNETVNITNSITNMSYINHDYQILFELCMPINSERMPVMHSKSVLLDELVKRVNHNLQVDNTDNEDDNHDYSSDEVEFDDEMPI